MGAVVASVAVSVTGTTWSLSTLVDVHVVRLAVHRKLARSVAVDAGRER